MGLLGPDLPTIVVEESDRHDLLVLAMGAHGHSADAADHLLYELGRARVVSDERLTADVVRMGSTVAARVDGGEVQVLRLAYPGDTSRQTISVFNPIGTALLGLRAGQTMRWTDRNGQRRRVSVLAVDNG